MKRMAAVVEGAAEEAPAMVMGRYSVETNEVWEFGLDGFQAASDEARMAIDADRSVYMYCAAGDGGGAPAVFDPQKQIHSA